VRAPYRGEQEALRAQADVLREELAAAREGSAELLRVQAELELELAAVERAQLEGPGRGRIGRRIQARAAVLGAAGALAGVTAAVSLFAFLTSGVPETTAAEGAAEAAEAWFARVRPRCNAVEVGRAIRRDPAPGGFGGQGYLAACYALADRLDDSRRVLDRLSSGERPAAATHVFDVVRPVADGGDVVAVAPVMELVLRYTPENFQALYYAGMGAYASGRAEDARRLLGRFVGMYGTDDAWRRNAVMVLERLAPRPPPPSPPPPPVGPSETPSRSDVLSAMQSVAGDVRACADEHGVVMVRATFEGPTGRAAHVSVPSDELDGATARCIGRAVRAARVPPFQKATFTVNFPYRL
jgi:hypothetical protein